MPPDPAATAPAVKALSCPSCGGAVELRAAGYTVTVACQYCGSILDVTNPSVRLIREYHQAAGELEIPLGTRGTLRGVEWEAIGYLRRSEHGNYGWEEYLLFNPYHGYRWLVKVRGAWSLGEMLTRTPRGGYSGITLDQDFYQSFFRDGEAQVDYVVGEFYWRVTRGENVHTDDYVRPGFMLSRESNDLEVSWTLNELLEPGEIRKAFGVTAGNPWPPLPHQPSPWRAFLKTGSKVAAVAALLLIAVMIFFGSTRELAQGSFTIGADRERTATIGPVTLTRPWQKVEIKAYVPRLENGWLDLDYRLVERSTQQAYDAYGAAERYSGYDSDGSWSEGSRRKTVTIPSVPAGTYDLVIDYKGNRWTGSTGTVTGIFGARDDWMAASNAPQVEVSIRQGMADWGLFLIALILLPLPLLWGLFRHVSFEQARQDESDVGRSGLAAMFTSSDEEYDE